MTNPHEYNTFIREFSREIHAIQKNMEDSDELLLTVSSGTPAMKSALLVLSTMLDYNCRMIQVTTPAKSMNEHSHKGYDAAFLWEADEDNEHPQNRCQEVDFQSLALVKYQNILKNLIQKYDYAGALSICSAIRNLDPAFDDRPFRMAAQRYLLNIKEARALAAELGIDDLFPIRANENIELFEYAANLFVTVKREEYVDFIRGITPLLLPLFRKILKMQSPDHIDVKAYLVSNHSSGTKAPRWDRAKLAGSRLDEILKRSFLDFRYETLYSVHIVKLTNELCPNPDVKDLTQSLRDIKSKVRNLAAHKIVSVTPQKVSDITGYSIEDCIRKIQKSFDYAGIPVGRSCWKTYEEMNQKILDTIPLFDSGL